MTSFTSLPLEIRTEIYKLSLITDKVIWPYVAPYNREDGVVPYRVWQQKDKIATGLLVASKMTRQEASPIIFSMNLWHMCRVDDGGYFNPNTPPQLVWTTNKELFRRVEVDFDCRDITIQDKIGAIARLCADSGEKPIERDSYQDDNLTDSHDRVMGELVSTWRWKLVTVASMHLDHFKIQMRYCSCPSACCQLDFFLLNDITMMGPWHRPLDPEMYEPTEWELDEWDLDIWEPKKARPANLDKMIIEVEFCGDHIETKLDVLGPSHQLGWSCKDCPLAKGKRQIQSCQWENLLKEETWRG